jgi:hypothetical protein
MVLPFYSKDTDCLIGSKRRTQQFLLIRNAPHNQRHTHRLKVKGQKKIYQASSSWKQTGIAILILNKAHLKQKLEEGHYILMKGIIHQEDMVDVLPI